MTKWLREIDAQNFKNISRGRTKVDFEVLAKVMEIVRNVARRGWKAVAEYTFRFDGPMIMSPEGFKYPDEKLKEGYEQLPDEEKELFKRVKSRIEEFHKKAFESVSEYFEENGMGEKLSPVESAMIYVPGGSAPLISSLLMGVIPAKVAGVKKIYVATPPGKDGKVNPKILAAAHMLGVDALYRVGGAQAIAAFALGKEPFPKVDAVAGPGNIYVNYAKKIVMGIVKTDAFAGPSEVMVIAEGEENTEATAWDLLAQAEHDPSSWAVLVSRDTGFVEEVQQKISRIIENESFPRGTIVRTALKRNGFAVKVNSLQEAYEVANSFAPEHLIVNLPEIDPEDPIEKVKNAGAIFVGRTPAEVVGDYGIGPNHVLPTGGAARFASALSAEFFTKKSHFVTEESMKKNGKTILEDSIKLAEIEGLYSHSKAAEVRLKFLT